MSATNGPVGVSEIEEIGNYQTNRQGTCIELRLEIDIQKRIPCRLATGYFIVSSVLWCIIKKDPNL